MEIQVCPTRSPGAKPSGHGTPSDLGLAVTAHRWPGVGRMPGVPSTGPLLFNARNKLCRLESASQGPWEAVSTLEANTSLSWDV